VWCIHAGTDFEVEKGFLKIYGRHTGLRDAAGEEIDRCTGRGDAAGEEMHRARRCSGRGDAAGEETR